jgi:hypothetical protein
VILAALAVMKGDAGQAQVRCIRVWNFFFFFFLFFVSFFTTLESRVE